MVIKFSFKGADIKLALLISLLKIKENNIVGRQIKHSFHREFGGNMKKELIEEYEDYTVWEVSEVVLLNPDGSYVPSYFGDIQIFEKQTNENRTSIFLRYYYKQPKLKYVNEDIHIIGVDVSTSDDYSSVSVVCRSCKSILHSTIYQPSMTCFSIPYYTKCPKCGVKISKHIYKENYNEQM